MKRRKRRSEIEMIAARVMEFLRFILEDYKTMEIAKKNKEKIIKQLSGLLYMYRPRKFR